MAKESKKSQSKFFLRLTVFILFSVCIVQAYIILKTRKLIKEKSLKQFVKTEFEKDKRNVEELFNSFLTDDDEAKEEPEPVKKEEPEHDTKPLKEKFDNWYKDKFGDSSITHTTERMADSIVVTVQINGVVKESVDVIVQDNIIKMSGNLKGEGGKTFQYSILVPEYADPNSSIVDFDAGFDKIKIVFKTKV